MITPDEMVICVFSYNRPRELENCLDAISRHAAGIDTLVLDDGSPDPEVRSVIARASAREIRNPEADGEGSRRTNKMGGLYGNMNLALSELERSGRLYGLFIQDDMQFVRDLESEWRGHANAYFVAYERAIQLQTTFLRGRSLRRDPNYAQSFTLDREVGAYVRSGSQSRHRFSATGLFHVSRTRRLLGEFRSSERENDRIAKERDLTMGWSAFPVMMWLPYPDFRSDEPVRITHRIAARCYGAGYHPFRPMSDPAVRRLEGRDLKELPIAESYLSPTGMRERDAWLISEREYGGVRALILRTLRLARRTLSRVGAWFRGPTRFRTGRRIHAD